MQQDNLQQYYMVVDEKSTGPFTLAEIINHPKLTPETLVWKPGIDNWVAAKTLPELDIVTIKQSEPLNQQPPNYQGQQRSQFNQGFEQPPYQGGSPNQFANNPQYQNQHSYHHHNQHNYYRHPNEYQNDYRPNYRTNWLPWAIVATIVGFFASCIGAIFGIIGIVQANKANNCYARGFDQEGDAANSNAKVMTIIGLIFAGIGIIVAFWFGNLFTSFSNLSYL